MLVPATLPAQMDAIHILMREQVNLLRQIELALKPPSPRRQLSPELRTLRIDAESVELRVLAVWFQADRSAQFALRVGLTDQRLIFQTQPYVPINLIPPGLYFTLSIGLALDIIDVAATGASVNKYAWVMPEKLP